MQLNDGFLGFFGLVGICATCAALFVFAYIAFDSLRSVIGQWRWNYTYKHRFDKQPTAKCYCKDCKWHSVKDNKCGNVTWADRHTPDNGFCYEAEPRKKEIDDD